MAPLKENPTPHDEDLIKKLNAIALSLRRDSLIMTTKASSGHIGGSLSAADIVAALYFHHLTHDPKNPNWGNRDRFILSKGHACPVVYAALAKLGYFPREELWTLRKIGSILQGHPDMRRTPGIEASTGTLGQGLSIGEGMALAARLDGKAYRVYVLLGDGELDEGQVWEAAMSASHYQIDNLTAIVDLNSHQLSGPTDKIMSLKPVADKWRAFGWHVIEIDGHRMNQILDSLDEAERIKGKPTVIIAHTNKGKGVSCVERSFAEGHCKYHGVPLTESELAQALEELHE
jgi:transketolase